MPTIRIAGAAQSRPAAGQRERRRRRSEPVRRPLRQRYRAACAIRRRYRAGAPSPDGAEQLSGAAARQPDRDQPDLRRRRQRRRCRIRTTSSSSTTAATRRSTSPAGRCSTRRRRAAAGTSTRLRSAGRSLPASTTSSSSLRTAPSGAPLPAPNVTGPINMSGTNGKIALVDSFDALAWRLSDLQSAPDGSRRLRQRDLRRRRDQGAGAVGSDRGLASRRRRDRHRSQFRGLRLRRAESAPHGADRRAGAVPGGDPIRRPTTRTCPAIRRSSSHSPSR